jgi:hypothetical protein
MYLSSCWAGYASGFQKGRDLSFISVINGIYPRMTWGKGFLPLCGRVIAQMSDGHLPWDRQNMDRALGRMER